MLNLTGIHVDSIPFWCEHQSWENKPPSHVSCYYKYSQETITQLGVHVMSLQDLVLPQITVSYSREGGLVGEVASLPHWSLPPQTRWEPINHPHDCALTKDSPDSLYQCVLLCNINQSDGIDSVISVYIELFWYFDPGWSCDSSRMLSRCPNEIILSVA